MGLSLGYVNITTSGTYSVAVSGHQPDDPLGDLVSNTVTATFAVGAAVHVWPPLSVEFAL